MPRAIAGVMGPGREATKQDLENARDLGEFLARDGWVVLTGGRDEGVMRAASEGAKAAGGLTVGILPSTNSKAAPGIDLAIITDMGNARNNVNVLTSHVVIACGMGAGTFSEIALALKAEKPVILLGFDEIAKTFFSRIAKGRLHFAEKTADAVKLARKYKLDYSTSGGG